MSRYARPQAFRAALEERIRSHTRVTGRSHNRFRLRLVMDRFAARVVQVFGDHVVLKGGMVLELRLQGARSTRDLDLHLTAPSAETLAHLQEAGRRDLGDHLTFEVVPDPRHPTIDAEGMRYEGLRFRVQARLGGLRYSDPFGVDAAFAEPMTGDPDEIRGSDFLGFAGIDAPSLRVYPVETHIAEKLHAYTMPRSRPNSRVKDLPDIALLARARALDASELRYALRQTFDHRGIHPVPSQVPPPAEAWRVPYRRMAEQDRLPWSDLDAVHQAVASFLDPVLGGGRGRWTVETWSWDDEGDRARHDGTA
ncbi:MAG: nucleotidyl transferase AbiEii/AbiGii toxin family protein [Alphaproteobacteria bacterium]|nr:nucleotidyl transferase AbiEii/AbiGii toxin family protein [Alphaproteobacteria bacterium]